MLELKHIPLKQLHESELNRRRSFNQDKLEELAHSIGVQGVIQPIVVRRDEANGYEIIAGARRYRASKIAALIDMPAIIKDVTSEAGMEIQLIEYIQREDLTPLEEAESYQQLLDVVKYKVADIAQRIGKSQEFVYARLKLNELNKKTRAALAANKISTEHAVLLGRIKDEKQQAKLLDRSMSPHRPFTVRELRNDITEQENTDKKNARVQSEIDKARAGGTKVVKIYEHSLATQKVGTYGPAQWTAAGKKKCDNLALGFVLDYWGAFSGRSLKVCLDPKKCPVHKPASPTTTPAARAAKASRLAGDRKVKAGELARIEAIGLAVGKVKKLDTSLLREITTAFADNVWHDRIKAIFKRRGWKAQKQKYSAVIDYRGAIAKRIATMRESDLVGLLVELTMQTHGGAHSRFAKRFRIDLAILKRQHLATLNATATRSGRKKTTKKKAKAG